MTSICAPPARRATRRRGSVAAPAARISDINAGNALRANLGLGVPCGSTPGRTMWAMPATADSESHRHRATHDPRPKATSASSCASPGPALSTRASPSPTMTPGVFRPVNEIGRRASSGGIAQPAVPDWPRQRGGHRGVVTNRLGDQCGDVDDQRDAAVAEDGRARNPRDVADQMAEWLDDDLLFADQALDD